MAVKVCGTILSSLFYENGNSKTDQEGLLLGKVINRRTNTISDSQISAVKEENFTYIYSYIPCSSCLSWYDNAGRVDIDLLKQILSAYSPKDVVGWYRFRRNSSMAVSLRERSVHKHLKETFPGVSSHHFVFLLCGMQSTANASTHCMDHVFLTNTTKPFQALQTEVINLGDTSHNEYKLGPSVTVDAGTGDFSNTISNTCNKLMGKGHTFASVDSLTALQNSISAKIKDTTFVSFSAFTSTLKLKMESSDTEPVQADGLFHSRCDTSGTETCAGCIKLKNVSLGKEVSTTETIIGRLRTEITDLQTQLNKKEEHLKTSFIPVPLSPTHTTGAPLTPRDSAPRRQNSRVSLSESYQLKRLSGSTSPTARKISDSEPDTPWKFDLEKESTETDAEPSSGPQHMSLFDFVELEVDSNTRQKGKQGTKHRVTPTVIEDSCDSMETDDGPDLINLDAEPETMNKLPTSQHGQQGETVQGGHTGPAPKFIDSDDISDIDTSQESQSILHATNPFVMDTPGYIHSASTSINPFITTDVPLTSGTDNNNPTASVSEFQDNPLSGGLHQRPLNTSSPAKKVKEDIFLEMCDSMKSSIKPAFTASTSKASSNGTVSQRNGGHETKSKVNKSQINRDMTMEGENLSPRVTRSRAGAQRKHEGVGMDFRVDPISGEQVKDDILCESMDESDDTSRSPVF